MISLVRQIESAVMSALTNALGDAALVTGFRESTIPGTVKTSDGDGRPEVLVQVQPATTESYGVQILEFQVTAIIQLRWSDDPTIAAFDEVSAIVERVLMDFNQNENLDEMTAALTTANFRCDGFALRGGSDSISLQSVPATISMTFNFALKGAYIPDTTNP